MTDLQHDLSKITPILLDGSYKKPKVEKMLAVLKSEGVIPNGSGAAVDLGCSAGFFCEGLAPFFKSIIGIDIDAGAISYAEKSKRSSNIEYKLIESDEIPLPDKSVDLIICNHVYEHVPDPYKLFREIERVLVNDGVCYFGAASRLTIIEPHFKLPFLSWIPKIIAHRYMKLFNKGEFYYENLRTYWGIKNLIKAFAVRDYTLDIIKDPVRFCADDMINPNGIITKLPVFFIKLIYPFMPSYIFILRKAS